MNIVVSLLIGGFIGWTASTVIGTGDRQGMRLNIAIGMTGAVLGFLLLSGLVDVATLSRTAFAVSGSLLSFMGAVVLLVAAKLGRWA
jgi:uncharacterized membrane protein YeaQ/YmgE (transglycosylase-associated protein family)